MSLSFANLRKAPIGSDPVDSTNTRGVSFFMLTYRSASDTGGDSTNTRPNFSDTNSVMAKVV